MKGKLNAGHYEVRQVWHPESVLEANESSFRMLIVGDLLTRWREWWLAGRLSAGTDVSGRVDDDEFGNCTLRCLR